MSCGKQALCDQTVFKYEFGQAWGPGGVMDFGDHFGDQPRPAPTTGTYTSLMKQGVRTAANIKHALTRRES